MSPRLYTSDIDTKINSRIFRFKREEQKLPALERSRCIR